MMIGCPILYLNLSRGMQNTPLSLAAGKRKWNPFLGSLARASPNELRARQKNLIRPTNTSIQTSALLIQYKLIQ
jgi:hypothetical protein